MNVSTYHSSLVWWIFLFFLWKIILDNILYQSKHPIYSNFSSFFTITNFVRHISKYFNESNDNKWQRKMKWIKKRKTLNMEKKLLLIKNYRLERLTEETQKHLLAYKLQNILTTFIQHCHKINHKFHICRCYFDDWSF